MIERLSKRKLSSPQKKEIEYGPLAIEKSSNMFKKKLAEENLSNVYEHLIKDAIDR